MFFFRGAVFAVGGPWVTQKLMVSEEEALSRFTPEEQKKILQKKREKEQEFEAFVTKLKEQTKSSKSSKLTFILPEVYSEHRLIV